MNRLKGLEPEKVYKFFEEISAVPRGSGNTAAISEYCLDFAEKRGMKAVKDSGGNVIIYADGTEGYENSSPFIIQGHMDMVCEKTAECKKDMEKEGLDLCTDGKYVWAEGTTLGGDDGIALAFMFAILDSDDIPHPPIEAVITRDEETGMYGAEELEYSLLKGKKLLNIDSEEEGILTVSCAGGISALYDIPVYIGDESGSFVCEISLSGLKGGHSGADIDKGRSNALKTMGELLAGLSERISFRIVTVEGGSKANVIPQISRAVIVSDSDIFEEVKRYVADFAERFAEKNGEKDPDAVFEVKAADKSDKSYGSEDTERIISFLSKAPNGVIAMSKSMKGIVQTSLNLGIFNLSDNKLSGEFLIRSNIEEERDDMLKKTEEFVKGFSGTVTSGGAYPPWEYREVSPLRDLMADVFREMYGKEPVISAIHAGLECAIFSSKLADADMVSIGPDIHNIHTPDEKMDIASVARTWNYVKEVLRRSK